MYFLAKNFRKYSKSLPISSEAIRLYRDGLLDMECIARYISYFNIHPEQLRQKLKERDAHMLCQFFDSEEYKRKVTLFLETQGKILSKDPAYVGMKPTSSIKYQHVLSCAQPEHKSSKIMMVKEPTPEIKVNQSAKGVKISKKGTIFGELLKKKTKTKSYRDSSYIIVKNDSKPKKFIQRSTIMPIFLKKIKERLQEESQEEKDIQISKEPESNTIEIYSDTRTHSNEQSEPLYAQINRKTQKNYRKNDNAYVEKYKLQYDISDKNLDQESKQKGRIKSIHVNTHYNIESNKIFKSKKYVGELLDQPTKKYITHGNSAKSVFDLEQLPAIQARLENCTSKSNARMRRHHSPLGLTSPNSIYEDVALTRGGRSNVVHQRMASSTTKQITTKLCPKKNMNLKSFSEFLRTEPKMLKKVRAFNLMNQTNYHRQMKITTLTPKEKLKQKSSKAKNNFEKDSTMMMIKNNMAKKNITKEPNQLELMSLFKKIKIDTSRNVLAKEVGINQSETLSNVTQHSIDSVESKPSKKVESYTYKIVAKNRERWAAELKRRFSVNPPYWRSNTKFKLKPPVQKMDEEVSTDRSSLSTVSKNIPIHLHRPVDHFVDHGRKAEPITISQFRVI